jgi:hypothetical protein
MNAPGPAPWGCPSPAVAAVDTIQTVTVSRHIQFAIARFIEDFIMELTTPSAGTAAGNVWPASTHPSRCCIGREPDKFHCGGLVRVRTNQARMSGPRASGSQTFALLHHEVAPGSHELGSDVQFDLTDTVAAEVPPNQPA